MMDEIFYFININIIFFSCIRNLVEGRIKSLSEARYNEPMICLIDSLGLLSLYFGCSTFVCCTKLLSLRPLLKSPLFFLWQQIYPNLCMSCKHHRHQLLCKGDHHGKQNRCYFLSGILKLLSGSTLSDDPWGMW